MANSKQQIRTNSTFNSATDIGMAQQLKQLGEQARGGVLDNLRGVNQLKTWHESSDAYRVVVGIQERCVCVAQVYVSHHPTCPRIILVLLVLLVLLFIAWWRCYKLLPAVVVAAAAGGGAAAAAAAGGVATTGAEADAVVGIPLCRQTRTLRFFSAGVCVCVCARACVRA
jgi:hypothetical protein